MTYNQVIALFEASHSARTRSICQWDHGMSLLFRGIDLPPVYEVHFSNSSDLGTAKTQIGGEAGVAIPDEYLETGLNVYAWVFLHAGEDDGESVYRVTIPVCKRPKPVEDAPIPAQRGLIDETIAALHAGVEAAQGAAERASEIANSLPGRVEAALSAAKASGEFDGPIGPKGDKGDTGERGPQGVPGQDYQLTQADKQAIAAVVIAELPSAVGVSF